MLDMSVKNKLYLAFGVVVLLMIIASTIVYVTSENLVASNRTIIEHAELAGLIKGFQDEHAEWNISLSRNLMFGEPFNKPTDPKDCSFGKWYYRYVTTDDFKNEEAEMSRLISAVEEPHIQLHEVGITVLKELQAGHRANAQKIFREKGETAMVRMDAAFSELDAFIQKVEAQHKKATESSEKTQKISVFIVTLIAALLGAAISILLSRSIMRVVGNVLNASESVANASDQISAGNQELAQRTQEQASALEETASTIEEMTSTVKQNAENAVRANKMAQDAACMASDSEKVSEDTTAAISEVAESSKRVADIINVINEIAFQTNLLALNAAVEAARAGEQGKGFAVVAGEVRNLAQRSAEAAKEIQELINDSVEKVGKGNKLVEKSGETLTQIIISIQKVADTISEISAASQEQAAGIDQVNKAVTMMDDVVQQNASLVEEAASASESLAMEAEELQSLMASFAGIGAKSFKTDRLTASKKRLGRNKAHEVSVIKLPQRQATTAKAAGAEDFKLGSGDDFEDF